jgi:UDP-3-O-[3-hydroxymyristoyl] glucosamine N-acyltransferase
MYEYNSTHSTFIKKSIFMEFTALQVAGLLNGKIEGNENVSVSKLAKIEEGTLGSLCFLSNLLISYLTSIPQMHPLLF